MLQLGWTSGPLWIVIRSWLLPSLFITYSSRLPASLSDEKAMRLPSGANVGSQSGNSLFVNLVGSCPPAPETYISWFPSRVEMNTKRLPRLFHLARKFSPPVVIGPVTWLPSGFIVYSCLLPDRFDVKTILPLLPHDGSVSSV